jgi:hypothetical protein
MSPTPPAEASPALPWDLVASAAARMDVAAQRFAEVLDSEQRGRALLPFERDRRADWGYTPRIRPGLPLRAMRADQAAACWALLATALSPVGLAKTRGVLALEAILQDRTARKAYRDPLNYALAIFGRPGEGPWAWRFEGHHVSLTFTLVPGVGMAVTPHFFGANPFSGHVVPDGSGCIGGVLERESALAFALIADLPPAALARALIAPEAPPDLLTGPGREASLARPTGLPLGMLPEGSRTAVLALLDAFFDRLDPEIAAPVARRTREAGLAGLHLAWAGGTTPDRLHYWRLHGPTLLIEYDRTDTDHAHSVWHDPTDPLGEDLLRAHRITAHAVA